jgi:hypothetical protein
LHNAIHIVSGIALVLAILSALSWREEAQMMAHRKDFYEGRYEHWFQQYCEVMNDYIAQQGELKAFRANAMDAKEEPEVNG